MTSASSMNSASPTLSDRLADCQSALLGRQRNWQACLQLSGLRKSRAAQQLSHTAFDGRGGEEEHSCGRSSLIYFSRERRGIYAFIRTTETSPHLWRRRREVTAKRSIRVSRKTLQMSGASSFPSFLPLPHRAKRESFQNHSCMYQALCSALFRVLIA